MGGTGTASRKLSSRVCSTLPVEQVLRKYNVALPAGFKEVSYSTAAFDLSSSQGPAFVYEKSTGEELKMVGGSPCTCGQSPLIVGQQIHNGRYAVQQQPTHPTFDRSECWEGTGWVSASELALLPAPLFHPEALEEVLAQGVHKEVAIYSCFKAVHQGQRKTIIYKCPTAWASGVDGRREIVFPGAKIPENCSKGIYFTRPPVRGPKAEAGSKEREQKLVEDEEGVHFSMPLPLMRDMESAPCKVTMQVVGHPRRVLLGPSSAHPASHWICAGNSYEVLQTEAADSRGKYHWALVRCKQQLTACGGSLLGYTLLADLNDSQWSALSPIISTTLDKKPKKKSRSPEGEKECRYAKQQHSDFSSVAQRLAVVEKDNETLLKEKTDLQRQLEAMQQVLESLKWISESEI